MWPEDRLWSFQLLRILGQSSLGGAEFAEVHRAASRIRPGDAGGWYDSFTELASANEASAAPQRTRAIRSRPASCSSRRRTTTAQRAASTTRHRRRTSPRSTLGGGASSREPGSSTTSSTRSRSPTREALSRATWMRPTGGGPRPTAIAFGGTDAVAEEMYLRDRTPAPGPRLCRPRRRRTRPGGGASTRHPDAPRLGGAGRRVHRRDRRRPGLRPNPDRRGRAEPRWLPGGTSRGPRTSTGRRRRVGSDVRDRPRLGGDADT